MSRLKNPLDGPFQVDTWSIDPATREIRADGAAADAPVQRLGHKPLSVLQCLAKQAGAVVTKDELIQHVWDGRITTDDAVMAVIYELRKALGDDARSPRYLETIRQRGYRLIAEVRTPLQAAECEEPSESLPPEEGTPTAPVEAPRAQEPAQGTVSIDVEDAAPGVEAGRRWVPAVGLALALALLGSVVWLSGREGRQDAEAQSSASGLEAPDPAEHLLEQLPEIGSLAIRPLATFGEQCREDPLVDSLSELLIAELVDGPPLEILGTADGVPWPREPTADAVVEGSIIRSGGGLWVNVRLVESSTGRLIWGASYERPAVDLLQERDLAARIAGDLLAVIRK